MTQTTLYARLGGYDAIAAVATTLLSRLHADPVLGRFWQHRGSDGVAREKQLLIDFLVESAGGPMLYTGRDMLQSHAGMGITDEDWSRFTTHLQDTLAQFAVPTTERSDVLAFIDNLRGDLINV
jgi:hemoglobin